MQEIDPEAATEGVHRKTLVLESLFNKFYQKETPTQVFSWEYCGTFKNTYFEEDLLTSASVDRKKVGKVGYSTKMKSLTGILEICYLKIKISIYLKFLNFSTLLVKL